MELTALRFPLTLAFQRRKVTHTRNQMFGWIVCCIVLSSQFVFAQTNQVIYTDLLGTGWQDWSWATVNLTNTAPVHTGTSSISVNAGANQALYLHQNAFDTSGYTNLTFWIDGGSVGGQQLLVKAELDGAPQTAVNLPALSSNVWQQITLSLASLGVTNKPNMDGFWIQDRSGSTEPTFYVDDIQLTVPPPPAVVHLGINASQIVRTADPRHFGVNTAVWDGVFDTSTTISLMTEMANQAFRFPGGSLADDYHWASNTTDTNTWTWSTSFDNFADVATNTHAQAFITVNYGSGSPTEAANWVQYSNVTKKYGFTYWEVGNENYGSWETDTNALPNDPYTYATLFHSYLSQMKAVDPSIKIGAVVITGEDSYATYTNHAAINPRTGVTHYGWTPVLLSTMNQLGITPNFVIYHQYAQAPGAENDAALLQSSSTWAANAADLCQQLSDYLGAAATNVELVCTENNSVYTNPGKQTTSLVNGLFMADSIGQILQTEFNGLIWWDLRNGQETDNNNDGSLYGWRPYGDYGIVDSATPAGPADRYPTFYVAKLLQHFARGGDQIVSATSDYAFLSVYGAKRTNGALTLLVLNKSPMNTLNANVAISGYTPTTNALVYSYGIPQDNSAETGIGSADVSQTTLFGVATNFSCSFAPYSATVISLTSVTPPTDLTIKIIGTNVVLMFSSISSAGYDIQCKNDLASGSWSNLALDVPGTGGILTNIDVGAASLPRRFYQVGAH